MDIEGAEAVVMLHIEMRIKNACAICFVNIILGTESNGTERNGTELNG